MKKILNKRRFKEMLLAFFIIGAIAFFNSLPVCAGGRQTFINKCGSCHGTGKEAPPVNPSKYAGVQWKGFFERDKHQRKKDISSVVSPIDKKIILNYLVKNAADSDQPEVAAIP